MDQVEQVATPNNVPLSKTLLKVAWMSVLLGLFIELLLLLIAAGFGVLGGLKPYAADLVQKVSWAAIVCVGIAIGTAATKMRWAAMGLLGLLAAPIGFHVARALHKGAGQALGLADPAVALSPTPMTLALIKAVEYGLLGLAVGWLARRTWGGVGAHLAVGLAVGVLFGGLTIGLVMQAAPNPLAWSALLARAANEIIFPMGCALVLFAAQSMGKRLG